MNRTRNQRYMLDNFSIISIPVYKCVFVCVCVRVYIYIAEEPLENKNEVLAPDLNVKNSLMSRRSLRASLMNEN